MGQKSEKINLIEKAMAELTELKRLADAIEKATGTKVDITITRVAGKDAHQLVGNSFKLPGISGTMKPGEEIKFDDFFMKRR